MFLILSWVEGMKNIFTEITAVYGKLPLFYFLVRWYIIHPIMFLIVFLQGYKSSDLLFGFNLGRPKGISGVNLFLHLSDMDRCGNYGIPTLQMVR